MNKTIRNVCPILMYGIKWVSELLHLNHKESRPFPSRNTLQFHLEITPNVISNRISEMSGYLAFAFYLNSDLFDNKEQLDLISLVSQYFVNHVLSSFHFQFLISDFFLPCSHELNLLAFLCLENLISTVLIVQSLKIFVI